MAHIQPIHVSPPTFASTTPLLTPQLLTRIRGEFREMPGLQLTLPQARRLLNLDILTCSAALTVLETGGFLRSTYGGAFVLADGARG
jgi:hypothetical protein